MRLLGYGGLRRRLPGCPRLGIALKLFAAFGGIALLAMGAAAVGWTSVDRLDAAFNRVTSVEIRRLSIAFGIKETSARFSALAPQMASARDDAVADDVKAQMVAVYGELTDRMAELKDERYGIAPEMLGDITLNASLLQDNLRDLEASVRARLAAESSLAAQATRVGDLLRDFQAALSPLLDARAERIKAADSGAAIATDFTDYAELAQLMSLANQLSGALAESFNALSAAQLTRVATRHRRAANEFQERLVRLGPDGAEAARIGGELLAIGKGENSAFSIRVRLIAARDRSGQLLTANIAAAAALGEQALKLVDGATTQVGAAAADVARTGADSRLRLTAILALAAVASIAVLLLVRRGIITRLKALETTMLAIADGRLDHPIAAGGHDEIAAMAKALAVFRDNAREVEAANARAEAERTGAARQRHADMMALADELERRVASVVGMLLDGAGEMQALADAMSASAEVNRNESDGASCVADQTRNSVQMVAAAAQQLSSSIAEISKQVGTSAGYAGQAVEEAGRTDVVMRALQASSREIGEVIELINAIASQTNLLALNATIEAARAGDAGRGFAVVANEVKQLAGQTAQATDKIGRQVATIQTVTEQVAEAIRLITGRVEGISGIFSSIASAVEQQDGATREIARNVDRAAGGTDALYQTLRVVAEAASRTGGTALQVQNASTAVARQVQALRHDIARVLEGIRAA